MRDLTAALVQIKPKLGRVADNLVLIRQQVTLAIEQGADLAVLPELALTGYFLKDLVPEVALPLESPELAALQELSRRISIVVGFVEVTPDFQFYNSAVWLEDGQLKHLHRKVYLPTYGLFDEQRYLGRGDRFRAFDTKFGRVGLLVCEDMWHLSAPYLLAMDGATSLVCLSSSPGRGVEEGELGAAVAWRNLTTAMARFLTCRVLYVNRVGLKTGSASGAGLMPWHRPARSSPLPLSLKSLYAWFGLLPVICGANGYRRRSCGMRISVSPNGSWSVSTGKGAADVVAGYQYTACTPDTGWISAG